MFAEYKETLDFFNNNFIDYFGQGNEFSKILNYSIKEGKRIRPIILIEVARMLSSGSLEDGVLEYAIALELIHNYSLIHDDLPCMDDDDLRSGRLTVHKKFTESMAVLAGDALLNKAFELIFNHLSNLEDPRKMYFAIKAGQAISAFSGIKGMIGGQVIDCLEASKDGQEVLDMYEKKTGGLIIAACIAGAYLSNSSEAVVEDMKKLGYYIGLCFQLQDDLLDLDEDRKTEKITYVSYAGEEKTRKLINDYSQKAINILRRYEGNEFLTKLVIYLIGREY